MKHSTIGTVVAIVVAVVITAATWGTFGYVVANRAHIEDQARIWHHPATATTRTLADSDHLSDQCRFLFYASDPVVEDPSDFNSTCSQVTADTSILGCYLSKPKRIYLYHVTDTRIAGTEEVMAAHELLRAAWDRKSPAQRAALLPALRQVESSDTEPSVKLADRMKSIRVDDPTDADAELYAIVGSEVAHLPASLTSEYGQYFADRSAVTALNVKARAYPLRVIARFHTLNSTLDALQKAIDPAVKKYKSDVTAYNHDVDSFNARAETPGGFATESSFQAARAVLESRRGALNSRAKAINKKIDRYNADLKTLRGLLKTAESLDSSLNITLQPLEDVSSA